MDLNDVLGAVIFMSIVFALGGGILWFIDKWTLPGQLSKEEKAAVVAKRSARWSKIWRIFIALVAAISLPVNFVGLVRKTEPLFPTIIWILLAAIALLGVLSPNHENDEESSR